MNDARQLAAYRGLASRIYLPSQSDLDALGAGDEFMPYAFPLFDSATMVPGGTVPGQETGNGYVSQPEDCFITHLVGSSSQDAGFALQVYDAERKALWQSQPINFRNFLGSAGEPFWLKRIYRLPANGQLQCQVVNLSTSANAIQVVAWGVRR